VSNLFIGDMSAFDEMIFGYPTASAAVAGVLFSPFPLSHHGRLVTCARTFRFGPMATCACGKAPARLRLSWTHATPCVFLPLPHTRCRLRQLMHIHHTSPRRHTAMHSMCAHIYGILECFQLSLHFYSTLKVSLPQCELLKRPDACQHRRRRQHRHLHLQLRHLHLHLRQRRRCRQRPSSQLL